MGGQTPVKTLPSLAVGKYMLVLLMSKCRNDLFNRERSGSVESHVIKSYLIILHDFKSSQAVKSRHASFENKHI